MSDLFDKTTRTTNSSEAQQAENETHSTATDTPLPSKTDLPTTDSVNHDEGSLSSTTKAPFRPLLRPLEKSYTALTRLVTPDLPLLTLAEEVSRGKLKSSSPTILVGLHTCGDLASTALRLFTATDALRAVCVVGCCYNHITESSSSTQRKCAHSRRTVVNTFFLSAGFPLSRCLQAHGAAVGRNARMLACQSETRFAEMTSGPSLESLFFRAVFQVQKFISVFNTYQSTFVSGFEEKGSLCACNF